MIDDARPDPDALLARLDTGGRGRLKIFLGAAPGVGKTWEMLTAANAKRLNGLDVVAGIIETHGRQGTIDVVGSMEMLPRLKLPYRGQELEEFNLDAALARHPALLLVDELAHTNVPGLRHAKRWQDVQELLEAGVNVWSTVNVQHLESLNDPVARITGVRVAETIPDTVLDMANEIELIDIPANELRARLEEGRIYRPDVARRALGGFFREGNLGALREMALRRAAQRIDKDVASYMRLRAIPGPWPVAEKVLALIGPDEAASNVVRHAARLADALRATLVAFHIERANDNPRVQAALDLAVQLGGTVLTQSAPDMVEAVLAYAAAQNVTHIVVGRAAHRWRWERRFSEVLIAKAAAFSLHFVPVPASSATVPPRHRVAWDWEPYAVSSALLVLVTLGGLAAQAYVPQEAMGLIFTGLIAAMASRSGRNAGLFTAVAGFFLWNFFFLPPVYTLSVSDPRDIVALIVFLLVGLVTGTLAGRVRVEASAASARVEALRRLSLFSQTLARAATLTDVLHDTAKETASITGAGIVLLSTADGELEVGAEVPAGVALSEAESAAAQWCAEHNVQTGLGTSTLPSVAWRFLPLRALDKTIGVLAARPQDVPSPTLAQSLATLAGQSAMAVERARVSTQTAKAQAKEDSQKLRDALLSSLSHDLRTPLTAIRGAAETLNQPGLDDTTRVDLQASIIQDTARMTRFLANITDMARAQAGATEARRERLRLETAVEEAVSRVSGALYTSVSIDPAASHVLADPGLLEQVLVNILENAVKYAPAGSRIVIRATRAGARVQLSVADEGVGIPPAELEAVFDSFFRASRGDRVAPGTGLGLAIAKSFTEAMGGRIWAQSPRPDLPADGLPGTVITLELPAA